MEGEKVRIYLFVLPDFVQVLDGLGVGGDLTFLGHQLV